MIIHRHSDGSEGYQYEVGDRVIVDRTIHGGWFDSGPTKADCCRVEKINKDGDWRIATHEIRYAPDWGTASCFPWMLKPHPETLAVAVVQTVRPNMEHNESELPGMWEKSDLEGGATDMPTIEERARQKGWEKDTGSGEIFRVQDNETIRAASWEEALARDQFKASGPVPCDEYGVPEGSTHFIEGLFGSVRFLQRATGFNMKFFSEFENGRWVPLGTQPSAQSITPREMSEYHRGLPEKEFIPTMHAVWLANGNGREAAALLGVAEERVMQMNGWQADSAYCSRPANWRAGDSHAVLLAHGYTNGLTTAADRLAFLKDLGSSIMGAIARAKFDVQSASRVELGDEVVRRLLSLSLEARDRGFVGDYVFAQYGYGGGLTCTGAPFREAKAREEALSASSDTSGIACDFEGFKRRCKELIDAAPGLDAEGLANGVKMLNLSYLNCTANESELYQASLALKVTLEKVDALQNELSVVSDSPSP